MKRSTELFIGLRSLFRLYDKLLKKVCTEHNLTVIEADIISFLQNNPGKDTAADIVELRMLSKGAVSKGVDSLIQKSLLERVPDTEDRRKIHLRLMPQAGTVTETVDEVRDEFLEDGFRRIHERGAGDTGHFFYKSCLIIPKKAIEGRDWS